MIREEIQKLEYLTVIIPALLLQIDEQAFSSKPGENIRSKKEIIGHLIDSATNNHQSLASFQHTHCLLTFYDLHNWNRFGYYRLSSQSQIIAMWESSNLQLLEIIRSLQDADLKRECLVGTKLLTIGSLIRKYIRDLEIHLEEVLSCRFGTEPGILSGLLDQINTNEIPMI